MLSATNTPPLGVPGDTSWPYCNRTQPLQNVVWMFLRICDKHDDGLPWEKVSSIAGCPVQVVLGPGVSFRMATGCVLELGASCPLFQSSHIRCRSETVEHI